MPNPYHLNVENVSEGANRNALERPSIMETFRKRVNQFWDTYVSLNNRASEVPANLREQYQDVMNRGDRIKATIEYVTNTYDAVSDWISDVFGFNGMNGLDNAMPRDVIRQVKLDGLGAVPFVPIAVIAAASGLIIKWLKDAYTMNRKLDEYKRLQDQGYDAERAADIVNKTVSGPGFFNLGVNLKPLMWIVGGGALLWIGHKQGWF